MSAGREARSDILLKQSSSATSWQPVQAFNTNIPWNSHLYSCSAGLCINEVLLQYGHDDSEQVIAVSSLPQQQGV